MVRTPCNSMARVVLVASTPSPEAALPGPRGFAASPPPALVPESPYVREQRALAGAAPRRDGEVFVAETPRPVPETPFVRWPCDSSPQPADT
eukprot:7237337-Prymnesium_polylepis.1